MTTSIRSLVQNSTFVIIFFALVKVLIHLYTNGFASYGIFRDEFYYVACSNRLDLGYVDHPPFSIYVLAASRFLFGESLFALRLLPALTGGILVLVTGFLTRRLGGSTFAVSLSCIAVIAAGLILGMFTIYSMNYLDYLFWILAAYVVVLLLEHQEPRYWIWLGIVLGLGLLNKTGVLWLCAGVFFGIIFTPLRSSLKTKWPYIMALVAFVLFLPYVIWNVSHNFAHLEFIGNATERKYGGITRLDFVLGAIASLNPLNVFIWIPGLYFFFFHPEGKKFRVLGIMFMATFLILFINGKSKSEYLGPAFPMLFAGGAVMIERFSMSGRRAWIWYALPVLLVASGVLIVPLALPILPVEKYISYAQALGVQPATSEGKRLSELPQFYADMFGWEEMAKSVSEVYQSLLEEEKLHTVIFAGNYGEAGALEYFSKKYPLARIMSPHNNYWYWGLRDSANITTAIVLGGKADDHKKSSDDVRQAAIVRSTYAIPYENNLPVYICRKIKRPFSEIWRSARFFI